MTQWTALVTFVLLTASWPAWAQEAANVPAPVPAAVPADTSTASLTNRPVVEARRVEDGTLRIDGVLDEPAWTQAQPATGFRQRDPDNGAPATERTEIRVMFDDERLVIGAMLYDDDPGGMLANQLQRDQPLSADDRLMITIDTYLDGRNGYFFEVNPAGAMGDGLIAGGDFNKSWDGIWLARVRQTNAGWVAEIAIPFATLNFSPDAPAWGINFQRTVRRKNEESLWTAYGRNQGLMQMANAGRLVGIEGVSQGLGLDVKPYALGTLSSTPAIGQTGYAPDGNVGVDLFYSVTPALRANISVNTDFAETEVDQRRVNLTRFPLFFNEKRSFFLEGSSFFDFSGGDGSVTPFFSRRIGLTGGVPQRIDVGAKLTGQAGAFDVGFLQVRTGETDTAAAEDFTVARLRRRMWRESHVGLLYTRRASGEAGLVDRQTAGADISLRTSRFRGNHVLELNGFYLWTTNPADTGESAAYGMSLSYPNDPFSANLSVRSIEANYDPAVGFVSRRGLWEVNPRVSYTWRTQQHPVVRSLEFEASAQILNDPRGRPLTREYRFQPFDMNFEDGSRIGVDISPRYEHLDDDFEIAEDVVLQAGSTYTFTRYGVSGSTADRRWLSVNGSVEFGGFLSGTRREYTAGIDVRPHRGIRLNLDAEHNQLALAEGSFDTDVFRAGANTQFGPWVSLTQNFQYDTVSHLLGWQARFRWIQRPGNDLFIVYAHDWQERFDLGRRHFVTFDSRAATKLVYTLRF